MSESIQKLTHVEHILKRPDSYVGPVSRVAEPYWIYENDIFERKNVIYSPALLKIFDEILLNEIDRNSMYHKNVSSEFTLLRQSMNKERKKRLKDEKLEREYPEMWSDFSLEVVDKTISILCSFIRTFLILSCLNLNFFKTEYT